MTTWRICIVEVLVISCVTGIAMTSLMMLGKEAGEIVSTALGGLLGFLTKSAVDTVRAMPARRLPDSMVDSDRGYGHGVDTK